jgi:hypothetical protein
VRPSHKLGALVKLLDLVMMLGIASPSSKLSTNLFVPSVTVIGRSVFFRSVKQGIPRYVVSSWIPPESVIATRDRESNAINER